MTYAADVPAEERTRSAQRCSVHGSTPSIAACDACGRPLCLACAIPVRGRTLGAECLATALGPDAPVPEPAERERGWSARAAARAAFVVAVIATALPWSRFGPGSHPFGAWSAGPRWSMLPALAAVAGVLLVIARPFGRRRARAWDAAAVAAGLLVAGGSVLALTRPPAFAAPWLGPWAALGAGLLASGTSLWALRRPSDRRGASV